MLFELHVIAWLILQTKLAPGFCKHAQETTRQGVDQDLTEGYDCDSFIQLRSNVTVRSEDGHLPSKLELASNRVQHVISDQHLAQGVEGTQNHDVPEKEDEQAMRLRQVEAEIKKVRQLLQVQHLEERDAESRHDDRRSVLQEEDEHARMKLHEAQIKIDRLQQELLLAQASSMDRDKLFSTLKTHWIVIAIVILTACCTLSMCACCGPTRMYQLVEGCIEADVLLIRTVSKLFYKTWTSLHARTQAAIIGMNLLTGAGCLMLWWITSGGHSGSMPENLLLLTVRWVYLGCVMCCLPGLLCAAVVCCELWSCCSDVQNNLGDYILEAATDVADFQQQVTRQTVKGFTHTCDPCWEGCKKTFGCSSKDTPQTEGGDPDVAQATQNLQVASRALQSITLGKGVRKQRPKITIKKEIAQG